MMPRACCFYVQTFTSLATYHFYSGAYLQFFHKQCGELPWAWSLNVFPLGLECSEGKENKDKTIQGKPEKLSFGGENGEKERPKD